MDIWEMRGLLESNAIGPVATLISDIQFQVAIAYYLTAAIAGQLAGKEKGWHILRSEGCELP